jgi:hypothetical protein
MTALREAAEKALDCNQVIDAIDPRDVLALLSELDTARKEVERLGTLTEQRFERIDSLTVDLERVGRQSAASDRALTAAKARIAELEGALEPFAMATPTNVYSGDIEDPDVEPEALFTENQFRHARKVYAARTLSTDTTEGGEDA